MHVLIIDDDIGDAELITKALGTIPKMRLIESTPGYGPGMRALNFYKTLSRKWLPDAIVQEATFNGGSAIELIQYAKSDKKLKGIPIIIYTGTDDEDAKLFCLAAGAVQVISKSIRGPIELVMALVNITS